MTPSFLRINTDGCELAVDAGDEHKADGRIFVEFKVPGQIEPIKLAMTFREWRAVTTTVVAFARAAGLVIEKARLL